MRNEVFEFKTTVELDDEYETIVSKISTLFYQDAYSYFVGRKDENIVIKVCVSSIDELNTIDINEREIVIDAIVDYLVTLSDTKCIIFKQPPLELILTLYQPMLKKMVDKLHTQWRMFEYDDIMQIANFTVVKLYRMGYYLHKKLIWTALNNAILVECRKIKDRPIIASLDDTLKLDVKVDSEELTYGDMIEDESYKEKEEREDEQQLEQYTFEQVKAIIIEKVGERRWDQLWRDYGKGHTTNTTQATMRRLKAYFSELGLTRQDFINGFRR